MMAAWQEQVEEDPGRDVFESRRISSHHVVVYQEWVRWHQKEAVMAAQRAQKEREARVLLKSFGSTSTRGTAHPFLPCFLHFRAPVVRGSRP